MKVVGELKEKKVVVGAVDLTISGPDGDVRVRCWDTERRGAGEIPNPVRESVNSVRVGEMVEAEIVEKKDKKDPAKTWRNLGSIAIIQGQAPVAGQSAPSGQAAVYPVGQSDAVYLDFIRSHGPVALREVMRYGAPENSEEFNQAWFEVNYHRFPASWLNLMRELCRSLKDLRYYIEHGEE